jgi:archaeal flagellin FlaB
MKTDNRGEMGVGTLIIFIAVILDAAVAAAVLISTAGSLQQKSLQTGGQAEQGVSTGAEAVSVMAINGTNHNVEQFEMLLRLQAGSESMNLNNTVVILDTATSSQNLDYAASTGTFTDQQYAAQWVKQGPDYQPGYLSRGDVVKVIFNTTTGASINENQKVRLKVIPRVGSPTVVEFTTPDVMTDYRISLWP